jgi:dihydrodipicolinate synthase/N-acetylneuraminate lyase
MGHSSAPRGLIVDLITPLKSNGEIDGRSLGQHLDRVLPHVDAVFIASPYAGEGIHLTAAQREDLLDKTLVVVRSRIPLLVWITQDTEDKTKETLLLLRNGLQARKYAGPVLWVDTPLYYHSNRGLHLHYRNLCTLAGGSWLLHNDPDLIIPLGRSFKRNNIRTAILKDLARIEEIQGLVFSGALERANNYQRAVRRKPEFRIYDGHEPHFLKHPSMSGVVSAGANLAPKAWRKLTNASLTSSDGGRAYPDQVRQIWETGVYLQKLFEAYQRSPAPVIKEVLLRMEVIESAKSMLEAESLQDKAEKLREAMESHGDRAS